jgi:DivIVA domain-containing protein
VDDPGSDGGVEALVERIDQARFTVAFRGFEPREVQDFLRTVIDDIRGLSVGDGPPAAPAPPQAPKTWAKAEAEAAELVRVAEEKAAAIVGKAEAEAEAIRAEAAKTLDQARAALLDSIRNANALIGRARTESDLGG